MLDRSRFVYLVVLMFLFGLVLPDTLFATAGVIPSRSDPDSVVLFESESAVYRVDDESLHKLAGISIALITMTAAHGLGLSDSIGMISATAVAMIAGGVKELLDSFGFGTPEERDFWNTTVGAVVGGAIMLFGGLSGLGDPYLYAQTSLLCSVPIITFYGIRFLKRIRDKD